MTPFAKVAATIGAAWIAVVAVATVWLITSRHSTGWHYSGKPPHADDIIDEYGYYTGDYVAVLIVATVLAAVAVAVAYVWAGKRRRP